MCLLVPWGCGERPALEWKQDAYVWQRHWTAQLDAAVSGSADVVDGWRVLGAETDAEGTLKPISPDWGVLIESERPITLVVRIDGRLTDLPTANLVEQITDFHAAWEVQAGRPVGLEIDHDSATAGLAVYQRFLEELRRTIGPTTRLSVTILPDWLNSSDLSGLLKEIDESVLQVHAVQRAPRPIFDPAVAAIYVRNFSRISTKPFRVALPAYGARLDLRQDGAILAVESEASYLGGADRILDASVPPAAVASFIREVREIRPEGLAGLVWFRLPTSADQRAWSLATWRAVVTGQPISGRIDVEFQPADPPGLSLVLLSNSGPVDVPLPGRIEFTTDCALADGANGYRPDRSSGRLSLVTESRTMIHEGRRLVAGWSRCPFTVESVHVVP